MRAARVIGGGAVGLMFSVIGGAAIIQTGLQEAGHHLQIVGIHHTGWLGLLELAFGIAVLASAFSWRGGAPLAVLGTIGAGFGFVIVITDQSLHSSLGVHALNGTLLVVSGGFLAAVGLLSDRTAHGTIGHALEHSHRPEEEDPIRAA